MGTSVDSEIALWSGTTGTVLKRMAGNGLVAVAAGVASALGGSGLAYLASGVAGVAGGSGLVRVAAGVPSAVNGPRANWLSGRFYDPSHSQPLGGWATTALQANRVFASPFWLPNDVTISEVAINCVALVNPSIARYGIYNCDESIMRPSTLIWQAPTAADMSTIAVKSTTGLSQALTGGKWYFTAVGSDAAPSIQANSGQLMDVIGYASHSDSVRYGGVFQDLTAGVLAATGLASTFTVTNTTGSCYRVTMKVA